jgi:hypothetical protein
MGNALQHMAIGEAKTDHADAPRTFYNNALRCIRRLPAESLYRESAIAELGRYSAADTDKGLEAEVNGILTAFAKEKAP